jgi:hypothetical protein
LRGFDHFVSASKITQQQFLLFRTVITKKDPANFDAAAHGIGTEITTARGILQQSGPFQSYAQAIPNNGFQGSGDFSPLRKQQFEVSEPDKDETPVNSTFINMLQAIAETGPAPHCCRWRHTKQRFQAIFGYDRGYTAVTDGQLQVYGTNAIQAIVECKSDTREGAFGMGVDMQEAAQIVAWIKCHEAPANRRIIISQDNDEVFVTFAEYDSNWLRYLRNGTLNLTSVMTMTQYGPWRLDDVTMVRDLAEIILAISL